MLDANLKIIEELKAFISIVSETPDILEKFSIKKGSFTRERKLPFGRLVLLIAKLCKKTLGLEIDQFFEELNLEMRCSVSAFSQQRMKLDPLFYEIWNKLLYESFYHYYGSATKRWKGYRLVAADGSSISLINKPVIEKYFGGQSNQSGTFVQAKAYYCYDVLNELILHSKINPYRFGELNMAYLSIDDLEEDMLMIYDRNFCNFKMVALHTWQEKEIKFVIRAKETQNIIKTFIKGGAQSEIVYLRTTPAAIEGLYKSGYIVSKDTLLKIRLVRVELDHSIEVLMTNLWEEEGYPSSEFKELYSKRWCVETNISIQKNILQLESFSGLTPLSIKQDFYATVFITNLHSILIKEAQQIIEDKHTKRKYPMKVNRNKSYGKMKIHLISIFINNEPEVILQLLNDHFIRDPVPIRCNRSFPRIIKNKQSRTKHKTYANYKPAY
jgi:Transposase DDE domain